MNYDDPYDDAAEQQKNPREKAPVQGYVQGIPWSMHMEAYNAYCKRYGKQQALIEGWCRGGFGVNELDEFVPGWREKLSEIDRLKARIAELEAAQARSDSANPSSIDQPAWTVLYDCGCRRVVGNGATLMCPDHGSPLTMGQGLPVPIAAIDPGK